MPLRLVEIYVAEHLKDTVLGHVGEVKVTEHWIQELDGGKILVKVLLPSEKTGPLLDDIEGRLGSAHGLRMVLLPVEAAWPRPNEEEPKRVDSEVDSDTKRKTSRARLSRQALYSELADSARLTQVFLVMVALSAIVAGVGILRGNTAVIVGAMVIAPLLGSNVALALATTLGDGMLARRAITTGIGGTVVALAIAVLWGLLVEVDPTLPEIANRTGVRLGDLVLSLAAGCAGALSITMGSAAALVGVMVAVSLLPPLVTCGLLLGAGDYRPAAGAMLLFLTNIIAVNLAGVATFLWQGYRPINWWKADRARKATRSAIVAWVVLLGVLAWLVRLAA